MACALASPSVAWPTWKTWSRTAAEPSRAMPTQLYISVEAICSPVVRTNDSGSLIAPIERPSSHSIVTAS